MSFIRNKYIPEMVSEIMKDSEEMTFTEKELIQFSQEMYDYMKMKENLIFKNIKN